MRYFLLLFFILFVSIDLVAQTKVSGRVFDNFNQPVAFANVLFKNANEGTITDENGRFYLESKSTHTTLAVSFVGYKTLEIELTSRTTYDLKIVLEDEASQLDEVVVYGGKLSKKDNPAIDILRKIWENRRSNGVKMFDQYRYDKYEKLEFDINTIDSAFMKSKIFKGMEFIFDFADTSRVTGKTYLPIFINEAIYKVYG